MKLWGIFRFEFAYQIRRAWPWLIFAVLLVLSFLVARDTSLADALYEDFFANSPFAIAKSTVVGTLVWLLLAPAVAGEAAARDVATGMHPHRRELKTRSRSQTHQAARRSVPTSRAVRSSSHARTPVS